jgi:hypothetical protein
MELLNQIGGLAGIAALLAVFFNYTVGKRNNQVLAIQVQLEAMNKIMESRQSLYKVQLDENSKLISKIEKFENKVEQLCVENAELRGQLREHGLIK